MKDRRFELVAALFVSGVSTFILLSILTTRIGFLGWPISLLLGGFTGYFYYRGGEVIKAAKKAAKATAPIVCDVAAFFPYIIKEGANGLVDLFKRPRPGTISDIALAFICIGYQVWLFDPEKTHLTQYQMLVYLGITLTTIIFIFTNIEKLLRLWLLSWNSELLKSYLPILEPYYLRLFYLNPDTHKKIGNNYDIKWMEKQIRCKELDVPVRIYLRYSSDSLSWEIYLKLWKDMLQMAFIVLPILRLKNAWEIAKVAPHTLKIWGIVFIREVHCRNRIICGTYGPLGGLISWILVGRYFPEMAIWMRLLATLGAGCLSVIIGRILGSIIIAKKVFGIQPNGS